MARSFDGTNDRISFGANASIGDFTSKTVAFWVVVDAIGALQTLVNKDRPTAFWELRVAASGVLEFVAAFSTTNGLWTSTTTLSANTLYHIVVVYDGSNVANNPTIYINGVADTVVTNTAPVGTLSADAAAPLLIGERGTGAADLAGRLSAFAYDNTLWTAAQVNRHRWWGRIGGAVKVRHPLLTTKLTNEGSATADGTATGTTVASLPRVQRAW